MKTLKTSLLIAALGVASLWTANSQAQVAVSVGPADVYVEPVRWRGYYRPNYYPRRYYNYRPYYRPYYRSYYYAPRAYGFYYYGGW
jgi:hypothetical protein